MDDAPWLGNEAPAEASDAFSFLNEPPAEASKPTPPASPEPMPATPEPAAAEASAEPMDDAPWLGNEAPAEASDAFSFLNEPPAEASKPTPAATPEPAAAEASAEPVDDAPWLGEPDLNDDVVLPLDIGMNVADEGVSGGESLHEIVPTEPSSEPTSFHAKDKKRWWRVGSKEATPAAPRGLQSPTEAEMPDGLSDFLSDDHATPPVPPPHVGNEPKSDKPSANADSDLDDFLKNLQ
jgi:hypothetical protein